MDCGTCTICCKLLNIEETDSKSNIYCKHCNVEVGCKIYNERPECCKIFECCWKQMNIVAEDLRPDNCGVLFEKWSDKVIVGSTNDELSKLVLGQINYFNNEGISILMIDYSKKSRTFYLAPGHNKNFVREQINDSPKLY